MKNEILPFLTTRMNLDGIMLSERSQREKDKQVWPYLYTEFYFIFFFSEF